MRGQTSFHALVLLRSGYLVFYQLDVPAKEVTRVAIRPAAGLVDRHDPWVLEASCDQCLAHEARLVAQAAFEQLFHGDRSAQPFVDGARYFAKATAGMLVDLLVAAGGDGAFLRGASVCVRS